MINKPTTCSGCPLYEPPFGKSTGFSYAVGSGTNGVMIVAEALGKDEEIEGMALVGKSGYQLFQQLQRVGIEREGFTTHNVLSCRPPDNKLSGEVYEKEAIERCSPNLDAAIEKAKAVAKENNKTFVIVTLGVIPFKRIMGYESKKDADLLKLDYYGYPFYSDRYACWVYAAPHPAYLLRGKTQLWPVLQFVFKRALEVANDGLQLETHEDYLLDPEPYTFDTWIDGYISSLDVIPDNPLSYDIETPYKKKTKDEEELGKEEDADHTILRIAFSYWSGDRTHTCSVKWSAEFIAGIERLFGVAKYVLGWNSTNYDYPRVSRHVSINGIDLDGMVAWHILNTSLPKSLSFVSPYYNQQTSLWKHLSESQPAFYNAKDAHMALVNYMGIKKDLIKNRLWHVFERHVIEINKVLKYMTGIGIPLDLVERQKAEDKLQTLLDGIEKRMEEAVPQAARKVKVFKKTPKDVTGMVEVDGTAKVKVCPVCGAEGVKAPHFKSIGKKRLKTEQESVCYNAKAESVERSVKLWAKPLEFKVSKLGLTNYQKALKHQAVISRKEKKVTFNADAIQVLIKKYPKDPLYPRILEHRETQKLLSTYVGVTNEVGRVVGGMEFDKEGRVHTTYTHNPSTLRFASESPNLQNLPRPSKDPNALANLIRNLIVAPEGSIFYARDFSGIEAVLTGYFALAPDYIRLARQDVHTYYTVYALYELEGGARIKSSDLPELSWPDDRLFSYLGQLKTEFGAERNSLYKHLVHAANFMQGAVGARDKIFSETGILYETKTVQKVMDVYYSLFPKIKQWHKAVLGEAEKDGYLRNPFDYVHRFSKVYDYKKEFGEWVKKPGPDANKAIAFKPQSTAAGIIKEAMLRLYFDRFQSAGQYLRLQVHDELFFECPEGYWKELDKIVKEEMERPVKQMALPASWGMGEHLVVLTEEKVGKKWGEMK